MDLNQINIFVLALTAEAEFDEINDIDINWNNIINFQAKHLIIIIVIIT
jgi:hypothetical protein